MRSLDFESSLENFSFGPIRGDNGIWKFRTWAPEKKKIELRIAGRSIPMEKDGEFWIAEVDEAMPGMQYGFLVEGKGPYPDPAGRFMHDGISGLSTLSDFGCNIDEGSWKGIELGDMVLYELHTGTFSPQGTYAGISEKIPHLKDIGINTVEIMPVGQFYGNRNWGYDGVYIYSPASCYGSPDSLRKLVKDLHSAGMGAILDVVYNHSGPVGNYLDMFGPFHSEVHRTPWGNCFNLDGPYSNNVRKFILENVIYWIRYFGFDGLRLDAVHGIVDLSPIHIIREIGELGHLLEEKLDRSITIIAETDQNDSKITGSTESCGYGIKAQWNDDFHHSLHTIMTGERSSYYMDYGSIEDLYRSMKYGFDYDGRYSKFLKRDRGTKWIGRNPEKLVVYSQNHDQVGNRAFGDRLAAIAGDNRAMIGASLAILSPYTPMVFMGEEIGSLEPFQFFVDTNDEKLREAVATGRRNEFREFAWAEDIPDPSHVSTFMNSRISWHEAGDARSAEFMNFYRNLINIRKKYVTPFRESADVVMKDSAIRVSYESGLSFIANLGLTATEWPDVKGQPIIEIPMKGTSGIAGKSGNAVIRIDPGLAVLA